jgi:VWFA-related protein
MPARAGVAFVCACLVVAQEAGGQNPTFRSNTDLVPVYVSVRNGRTPVGNLTAADFDLTDRGVPQTVSVASYESLPIDVTLVVDTSASVITSLDRFRSDVRTIVGSLRADEQIRLITFDTDVRQLLPMQAPSERPPVREIRLGDRTSLIDAITLAMARARRPDRRHLVFVFTDGYDTSSALDYGALPDLASRIDGLLHIVLVRASDPPDASTKSKMDALAAAAARTGGALYPPAANDRDIVYAFNEAIDAFRHSYVVYFTPSGVERPGWHDVVVRVKRPGTYTVRAREGYFGQ